MSPPGLRRRMKHMQIVHVYSSNLDDMWKRNNACHAAKTSRPEWRIDLNISTRFTLNLGVLFYYSE